MWRQGDVMIERIDSIPDTSYPLPHLVLAEGEMTGHRHRVAEELTADLYGQGETLFLNVKAETATVVHDEHGPITLPRGTYRVWKQREYSPRGSYSVMD